MTPIQAIIYALAVLVIGAAVTAVTARSRRASALLAVVFVAVAAALILWGAAVRLGSAGAGLSGPVLARVEGLGAELAPAVDPLSALFLLVIAVMAFLSTLYSTGHLRVYGEEHPARYYPILLIFFAGVMGVVVVRDWFFFLVFWELMTVCSYFLVVYEKENPVSLRAGLKYVVTTHVATLLMLIGAVVLWHTAEPHSFSFAASAEALGKLGAARPVALYAVLALWLVGFATKAGILPFGDWLPDAYPAAPTGATAAFAGTMTKLGIYGLLRVFVELLPVSPASAVWGVVIAVLGTGSIFVGTITALSQDNVKRLMSFHVIGQMGYMFLGIGMGVYFLPTNPKLALVALLAGVFHLLNHVIYKSLLFFTAGSLQLRARTLSLDAMGGMAKVLPATALAASIGALSIAGVPPFNGFSSKWLIYQVSVIGGIGFPLFLLLGLTAMFISLVTLASFLKYLGAAFLGQRSEHAASVSEGRQEVPLTMQAPQVVLGACCLAFGLFPMGPLTVIGKAIGSLGAELSGVGLPSALGTSALGLSFAPDGTVAGVWNPVVSSIALVICVGLAYGLGRLAQAPSRVVPVWHCGVEVSPATGHFHAHGLYEPFRRAFERVYIKTGTPKTAYPVALTRIFDFDAWLYGPLVRAGGRLAARVSRSHVGVPQWYLAWQVIGMVLVLALLFALMR
jgi:hydrogenase-4 component B